MQDFEPIKQAYRDFAKNHNLVMAVTKLGYREKGDHPHFAFNCYLSKGTNGLTVEYRVGVGIPMDDPAIIRAARKSTLIPSYRRNDAKYVYSGRITLDQDRINKAFIRAAAAHYEPSIEDLLNTLKSDLSCVYYPGVGFVVTFEEFCKELGYNNDSIKDQKVYQAVMEQSQNLLKLLGYEALNELLGMEGL